jgi:exonuclease III
MSLSLELITILTRARLVAPIYLTACGILTIVCIAVQLPRRVWGIIKPYKYILLISIVLFGQEAVQLAWLASLLPTFLTTMASLLTPPLLIATAMWAASWIIAHTITNMRKYRNASILICVLVTLAMCSPADATQHTKITHTRPLPLPLIQFLRTKLFSDSPTYTQITANTTRRTQWHRIWPHIVTALKLSPLVLLHPHQLVVLALSLLPQSKTTLGLMALSQLPHVMANVGTEGGELSAASTLSTLLATAWTNYLARAEITEPEIGPETPYTVTGGISTDKNKFCMQTLNIQGGITEADKLMAIQDIVTKYEPDAMAISEAGSNCKANKLKWLNKQLKETNTSNGNEYLSSLDADFPYTIVSASTSAEHERGGIVFLLHNKWRHRVVGKPIIDHNGRWICIDVRTPRGRTSIIATYLPPSPQNSAAAKLAWAELQEFVISRHLKCNRTVYLFGDLNASRNNPLHRKNTGEEDTGQDRLLNTMMEHGGLVHQ